MQTNGKITIGILIMAEEDKDPLTRIDEAKEEIAALEKLIKEQKAVIHKEISKLESIVDDLIADYD